MKTLRIALAMGGGASLGSFSGAALTESIKQLILFGRNKDGEFDKLVIDGMSGASAGAVSLAILLRCLMDYESMRELGRDGSDANFDPEDDDVNMIRQICKEYEIDYDSFTDQKKKKQLCAIQVAQNIQKKIWIDELNIKNLMYDKGEDGKIRKRENEAFGFLDRDLLKRVMKTYLIDTAKHINLKNIQLLDSNRVIFACSLTNLLPMPLNANLGNEVNGQNYIRSVESSEHSELRVIDFVFDQFDVDGKEINNSDSRWIVCDTKKESRFNLNSENTWKMIGSTVAACGAFPIAFPSVLLKRYEEEYIIANSQKSLWPGNLRQLQKEIKNVKINSFFQEGENSKMDYTSFNFPYVDGGTFNNEPIKEAFRISSFQDFDKPKDSNNYPLGSRALIFVDPIVRTEEYKSFNLSALQDYSDKDGEISNLDEASKLLNAVTSMIGPMINQGSIKEEQKVLDFDQNFKLREYLISYLDSVVVKNGGDHEFIEQIILTIENYLNENIISIGTRKVDDYLKEKYNLNTVRVHELRNSEKALNINSEEDKDILRKLFKILADLALDTAGKNPNIDLITIQPARLIQTQDGLKPEIIDLPGHEIAAFAGFSSTSSQQYVTEYAKLNAFQAMSEKYVHPIDNKTVYLGLNSAQMELKVEQNLKEKIKQVKFTNQNYKQELNEKFVESMTARLLSFFDGNLWDGLKTLFKINIMLAFKKKKFIKETLFDLTDTVDKHDFISIPICLKSKSEIKTYPKKLLGILKRKSKFIRVKLSSSYEYKVNCLLKNNNRELWFTLYLQDIKDENGNVLRLSPFESVKKPTTKDPNLEPEDWQRELESKYPAFVNSISINKDKTIDLAFLNDRNFSLYFSLRAIKSHVNPSLEYDLDNNDSWKFVERTPSFETIIDN
jgi:hypothetical protein